IRDAFALEEREKELDVTQLAHVVIPRGTAQNLALVFAELASNHRVHGKGIRGKVVARQLSNQGEVVGISIALPVDPTNTVACQRLEKLAQSRMQAFVRPAEDEDESSGVGLYLATLAGAVVGWELSLEYGEGHSIATFRLNQRKAPHTESHGQQKRQPDNAG